MRKSSAKAVLKLWCYDTVYNLERLTKQNEAEIGCGFHDEEVQSLPEEFGHSLWI